jgi:hypothetical protein
MKPLNDNKNTKLLILGLDGLEHSLVKRWNLSKLIQVFQGEFYVGNISKLYTPLIWSSILCGFNVENRGYSHEEAVRKSMGVLGILHAVKKRVMGVENRSWLARKILKKIGFLRPPNFIMPEKLMEETFLRIMGRQKYDIFVLEVPGYNEMINGVFRMKMAKMAVSGTKKVKIAFIEEVKQDTMNRLLKTKQALRKNDVVMFYSPLPDLAHHLFFKGFKDRIRIGALYKWIEHSVFELVLKDAYKLNFNVLILSDHGFDMKKCYHSKYGYWSANFQTQIKSFEDVKASVFNLLKLEK